MTRIPEVAWRKQETLILLTAIPTFCTLWTELLNRETFEVRARLGGGPQMVQLLFRFAVRGIMVTLFALLAGLREQIVTIYSCHSYTLK